MHADRPGTPGQPRDPHQPAGPGSGSVDPEPGHAEGQIRIPSEGGNGRNGRNADGGERPGYTRDEPLAKQLDRNYGELLQELRVAQTGVQILFAFLLTIPFQATFAKLSDFQNDVYLATLLSAAVAVVLLIAPVATHRLLFRRRQKDELVHVTARLAAGGLTFLAIAISGAVLLIVDLVAGLIAAAIVTATLGALIIVFWLLFPASLRRQVTTGPPSEGRPAAADDRPDPGQSNRPA